MLEIVLQGLVLYLTFVHPVLEATRLLRKVNTSEEKISNLVVSIVLLWLLEVLDSFLLSQLIAAKNLYFVVRLAFSLYLLSPVHHGGLRLYKVFLKDVVLSIAPTVEGLVQDHIAQFRSLGTVDWALHLGRKSVVFLAQCFSAGKEVVVANVNQ